jgi:hypothetical protein
MLNFDCIFSTCHIFFMTNKEAKRKKFELLQQKIAESYILSLVHGVCGSGLKLLNPKMSQHHPSRICFTTSGWHITRNLNLLFLTLVWLENSNMRTKNVCARQSWHQIQTNYKSQPLIHKQMQSLRNDRKMSMTCSDHLTWKTIAKI